MRLEFASGILCSFKSLGAIHLISFPSSGIGVPIHFLQIYRSKVMSNSEYKEVENPIGAMQLILTSTLISSFNSLIKQASGVSLFSILPPGNSQQFEN